MSKIALERSVPAHGQPDEYEPRPVCICGHAMTSHDIVKRKAGWVRTRCWRQTRDYKCPCTSYEAVT